MFSLHFIAAFLGVGVRYVPLLLTWRNTDRKQYQQTYSTWQTPTQISDQQSSTTRTSLL